MLENLLPKTAYLQDWRVLHGALDGLLEGLQNLVPCAACSEGCLNERALMSRWTLTNGPKCSDTSGGDLEGSKVALLGPDGPLDKH